MRPFRQLISLALATALAACGSGSESPSQSELKRACIDSGAFTMADNKNQICDCMVRQIRSADADASYALEHWRAQKDKNFGKSILPSSMQGIKQRCGGYG